MPLDFSARGLFLDFQIQAPPHPSDHCSWGRISAWRGRERRPAFQDSCDDTEPPGPSRMLPPSRGHSLASVTFSLFPTWCTIFTRFEDDLGASLGGRNSACQGIFIHIVTFPIAPPPHKHCVSHDASCKLTILICILTFSDINNGKENTKSSHSLLRNQD